MHSQEKSYWREILLKGRRRDKSLNFFLTDYVSSNVWWQEQNVGFGISQIKAQMPATTVLSFLGPDS